MNKLISEGKRLAEEIECKPHTSMDAFQQFFDLHNAAYVLRLYSMIEDMREALINVSSYFDCLNCENSHGMICEHHLYERIDITKSVLKKWGME